MCTTRPRTGGSAAGNSSRSRSAPATRSATPRSNGSKRSAPRSERVPEAVGRVDAEPTLEPGGDAARRSSTTWSRSHDGRRHRGRTSAPRRTRRDDHRRRGHGAVCREADGALQLEPRSITANPSAAARWARCCGSRAPASRCTACRAADTGEAVFVPQVPQREVRALVRPEFHQCLRYCRLLQRDQRRRSSPATACAARCSSTRDTPGRPVHDRRPSTSSSRSPTRIGAAIDRAERRTRGLGAARRAPPRTGRVDRDHGDFDRARDWLIDEVVDDDPAVAVVDLDTAHRRRERRRSPTWFGTTVTDLQGALAAAISSRRPCDVDDIVRAARGRRVRLLHASCVARPRSPTTGRARRRDRAPRRTRRRAACCTSRTQCPNVAPGCTASPRYVPVRDDWGHASDLDDVRGEVAIVGIGETAYTKASGRTAREIGAEAVERAIADAGLEPADIDGITWSGAFADFDVAAFHEHFGTTHDMWTSPWGGGMAWAATAPYLAAQAIRDGQGPPRAQRVPGRVGDAAVVDDRRPGRGARGAVAEAEPRSAVRLVPAARLLRDDHAPAHDRVRHDARAVRRGRGRVPPPRQPASRTR